MPPVKKIVKRVVKKKKEAPLPEILASKPKAPTKVVDPLIQKRPRNFGIGQDILPKNRDLTRYVKWPPYIKLQRQRKILYQRIKVPPPINQFRSQHLDNQTCRQLFKLLDKYRPEDQRQKRKRLRSIAKQKAAGKEVVPEKRPPTLVRGANKITTLVEQKKAKLVVIAFDVDPIELVVWLPSLCRKMQVPYCIVKCKARLGRVVRQKTATCVAITTVSKEDLPDLQLLAQAVKENYNDKYDEIRKTWGGGMLSIKSQRKLAQKQKTARTEGRLTTK